MLGWSDGGITGLMVAARNQERVKKLVIWGSNAYVDPTDIPIFEGELFEMKSRKHCMHLRCSLFWELNFQNSSVNFQPVLTGLTLRSCFS